MSDMTTQARLHDRDPALRPRRGDRARRAAQAAAPVRRVRLSATRASWPRCSRARATGYAYGRQGNPTTAALEAKVNAMEDGVATVVLRDRHGGDRRDAAGAAEGAATTSSSSQFLFGNTNSLFRTLDAHGTPVTFVDATDVANVEAALTPETRLVFVETIANPRTQVADLARIGELCAARGIALRRRQHDDVAVAVQAEDGRREPRRQRADQVHRRPRQRAGRQRHRHRPLRLDALPEHRRQLQVAKPPRCGGSRRSARKGCATSAARWRPSRRITSRSAPRRSRCAWSGSARTRRRSRDFLAAHPTRARRLLPGACHRIRSTRSRASCSADYGALFSFELADGHRRVRVPEPAAGRRAVVEPRRQPHARDPGRAHDLLGDGRRRGARRWASPIR